MAGVRVLVVDDVTAFLGALVSVVDETPGFEIVGAAASGEDALVVAASVHPDLVLLDVSLPGIDGLEVARRLLTGDDPPAVVLLSTYDDDAGEQLASECGAGAYITKAAFGPDRLERAWAATRG